MQNCQLSGLISIVDCLVDEKVGIVKHVNYIPREVGAPDFFHYAAEGCDAKAFNAQRNSRIGGGASYDRNIALAKAIGEVVERYSSAIYEIEDFPLASATCAAFPCVDPSRFALYSNRFLCALFFRFLDGWLRGQGNRRRYDRRRNGLRYWL